MFPIIMSVDFRNYFVYSCTKTAETSCESHDCEIPDCAKLDMPMLCQ